MTDYLMPNGSYVREVPKGVSYEHVLAKWQNAQPKTVEKEVGGVGDAITQAASSIVQGAGHAVDLVPNFPRNVKNLGSALTGLTAHGVASGAKSLGLDAISRGAESVANAADESIADPYSPVSRVLNAVPDLAGYELKQPNTPLEKQIDYIGQGVGGMAVMPLTPAMTIGRQLLIGGGAGSAAGNVAEATDSPALGALAGLITGGAAAGASAARSTASLAKNNLRSPLLNGQRGAELAEGDLLRQYSDKVPVQTAVDALEASIKAPKVDPNSRNVNPTELKGLQKSKTTTGRVLAQQGDDRILALEKPISENFNTRQPFDELAQNNRDARAEQLLLIAGRDEGAGDLQVQLNAVKAKQEAIAEANRLRAANTQAQAVGKTGDPTSKLQAGTIFEQLLDDVYAGLKADTKAKYGAMEGKGISVNVPMAEIESLISDLYKGAKVDLPASISNTLTAIKEINSRRSGLMTYEEMQALRSARSEAENAAKMNSQPHEAQALGVLKRAIDDSMQQAVDNGLVPPEFVPMWKDAKLARVAQGEVEKGAIAKLLPTGEGQNIRSVKTEAAPALLLQGGKGNFDSFQRSIGREPLAAKTAQDYLANDWRESVMTASGEFKPTWKENSNQWLRRNNDVLSNFPDLRTKLEYAIAKSEKADALAVRLDKEMKGLEKSGAGHFLKEKDPDKAFTSFIKSGNRTKDMDFIARMIKRDPEFKRSFRGALHEHLLSLKSDNQLAQFIESPKNQIMIERLLGKDILEQYKKVAVDVRRDLLRDKVTSARGSQTAPNEVANAALRTVNNLPMGIGFLSRVIGSKVKANSENLRSEVRQKSFLEPAYAAKLLKMSDEKPNYRGALTDSAKLLKEDTKRAVVGTASETEAKRKAMAKALMKKGS